MISAVTLILSPELYCLTIKPLPYLEVSLLEYVKNAARIILATSLPSSWLRLIKGIPTNATTSPVALPLPSKPPAVGLVVVVVGRLGGETVAPGRDPGGWVDEPAVGGDLQNFLGVKVCLKDLICVNQLKFGNSAVGGDLLAGEEQQEE